MRRRNPEDRLPSRPYRPEQVTRIRPRFDCLVEKVYVKVGQTVKKGDPLVDLFSTDLAAAKSDYETAEVQWKHDRKVLEMRRKWSREKAHLGATLGRYPERRGAEPAQD